MSINSALQPSPLFPSGSGEPLLEEEVGLAATLVDAWLFPIGAGDAVAVDQGFLFGEFTNNNDLTRNGSVLPGPSSDVGAKFSRKLAFDSAAGQFLSRADEASLRYNGGEITFCAWAYMTNFNLEGAGHAILSKRDSSAYEYELSYSPITRRWIFGFVDRSGDGKFFQVTSPVANWSLNTWYLLIAYYDPAAGRIGLHVNAAAAVTAAHIATGFSDVGAPFVIGARGSAGNPAKFHGSLEQVLRFNRLLNSAEKASLLGAGILDLAGGVFTPASEDFPPGYLTPSDPPSAPTDLALETDGPTATLGWVCNSPHESSVEVERDTNGDGWERVASLSRGTTEWTDPDADVETTNYQWRVRSVNGAGESDYSNTVESSVGVAVDAFQDFHTGVDFGDLSDAVLSASKRGDATWEIFAAGSTAEHWYLVERAAVDLPQPIVVGGEIVTSTGVLWAEGDYDLAGAYGGSGYEAFRCVLPGLGTDYETCLVEGFLECLFNNPTITGNNLDVAQIDTTGGGYSAFQAQTGQDGWGVISHTQGANGPAMVPPQGSRVLYFQLFADVTTDRAVIRFYDPDADFVYCGESEGTLIPGGTGIECARFNFNYANLGDLTGKFRYGGLCVTGNVELRDPVTPVTAPPPDPVTLLALGSSSFSFEWDEPSGALDGYRYDVATDAGFTSLVVEDELTATPSGTVTGLDPSTQYYFRVRSVNAVGSGENSDTFDVTTSASVETNWVSAATGGSSGSIASGKRGWKITVGASDVEITKLMFWFRAGTYANVPMEILDDALIQLATATIPIAGATANAWNEAALSGGNYTLLAGLTYYILADVSGFNDYSFGGTHTANESVASKIATSDETGANPGHPTVGVSFKYLS